MRGCNLPVGIPTRRYLTFPTPTAITAHRLSAGSEGLWARITDWLDLMQILGGYPKLLWRPECSSHLWCHRHHLYTLCVGCSSTREWWRLQATPCSGRGAKETDFIIEGDIWKRRYLRFPKPNKRHVQMCSGAEGPLCLITVSKIKSQEHYQL